jgi:RNA polymerase sigma-70 factor (ECF subfamily)
MLRVLRFGVSKEPQRSDLVDPLRALATLAASGDRRAQRTLLVELGPSLLRTARAILGAQNPEAEDALQESMAALISALPGFRGECTVRHFCSRVALQTALKVRRRARLRTKYVAVALGDELADIASLELSPVEQSEALRRREALRELLLELPEIHSEVLALHVVLGFTVEETAATLSIPVNTVRSRLRRALASLRDSVQGDPSALEVLRTRA